MKQAVRLDFAGNALAGTCVSCRTSVRLKEQGWKSVNKDARGQGLNSHSQIP